MAQTTIFSSFPPGFADATGEAYFFAPAAFRLAA